jgi:hypothetical protein
MKLFIIFIKFLGIFSLCFLSCSPWHTSFSYIRSPAPHQEIAQRQIPIWIDKNFGDADQISLQTAIDQWNYALNGYIVLQVASTGFDMETYPMLEARAGRGWLFLKINSDNAIVAFHDRPHVTTLAVVDNIGGNTLYLIRDRVQNDQVTGLAMHEMGHLLGARHVEGDDLMTPIYNSDDYRCIDYLTIKQVATFQHLPLENLNYCVLYTDSSNKGQ